MPRLLPLQVLALISTFVGLAQADLSYEEIDRATVRVMAVSGVIPVKVDPPKHAIVKKPFTIAVAEGGHGSGLLVSGDGIVVTAAHVVENAEFVAVKLPWKDDPVLAGVIFENKKHDVAFLKLPGHYQHFVALPAAEARVAVRDHVFIVGYPLDATRDLPQSSAGVVSGELPSGELQLALSANPGNSGGPLLNNAGEFMGIVIKATDPTKGAEGLSIAVPASEVIKFYQKRVLGSKALKRLKADDKKRAQLGAVAGVVNQMASISSLGTAIDVIEGKDPRLPPWLKQSANDYAKSADFLALLAAHYWNVAAIRRSLDGRYYAKPLRQATSLSKRAVALDPRVVNRSPFLLKALGSKRLAKNKVERAHSAPRMIAGIRMGWSFDEAKDACEMEGFSFTQAGSGYRCSRPPYGDDTTGPVNLRFCSGKVCRVELIDRPSRSLSSLWVAEFYKVYNAFKRRYGKHQRASVKVPAKCRTNLLSCLESGKAQLWYTWGWDKRRLTLSLGRKANQAVLKVTLVDSAL